MWNVCVHLLDYQRVMKEICNKNTTKKIYRMDSLTKPTHLS